MPTATATCRPRMWVQHISKGQINEPTPGDAHSSESNQTGISAHVEEIPEELGHESRVLHPFEIPGVQFPTDATPPNQRRLAENDALVELIQTTKYLEDTPTMGQRDYQLYPLSMVIPSIEEEKEVEVGEGEIGSAKDLWKDQIEEWEEESHWNDREVREEISQTNTARDQQDRWEEDWSVPTSIERREDVTVRQELHRAPPTPPPSED